ncbi:hypothetical protein ADE_42360 [Achromobacter denitrificans]|nr:hypothetical protein ADE_42360 [Achromobacter denitrificans]
MAAKTENGERRGREAGRPIPWGTAAADRYRMAADASALGRGEGRKRNGKAAAGRAASGIDGTRLF